MNVLVTGANGFVGLPLCRLLARSRMRVRGAVRTAVSGGDFEPIAIGDIGANTAWDAALKDIDVVVHLAARVHIMRDSAPDPLAAFRAVNVHGTVRLAEAAREAGVKRFVFLSSAKVHGEASADHPFSEADRPQPYGPYAVSKWEAEQALAGIAGSDMQLVVLRPPLVYGPHVRGNFLALLRAVERRWPLPLGAIANRRSLLYVGNLADAIARSVSHVAAAGRTFLVSDGEDLSTPELVRALAAGLGVEPHLIKVPRALLLWGGTMIGRRAAVERLIGSLQVDSRRICSELDWMPPYSAAQGLEATARWYRQAGDSAAV
jgi:nucleoside-diphosphate-sugar epimerase